MQIDTFINYFAYQFTLYDKDRDTCWIPPRNFTEKEQRVIEQEVKEIAWYPYPIAWDLIKKGSENES